MFGRIDIDEYERDRKKEAAKLTAGVVLATKCYFARMKRELGK